MGRKDFYEQVTSELESGWEEENNHVNNSSEILLDKENSKENAKAGKSLQCPRSHLKARQSEPGGEGKER